jgi:predicted O-methyltransferase YrrM
MMTSAYSRLFFWAKKHHPLKGLLLFFYFARFVFYAVKENSVFFFRYYPGYHGSTIPSLRRLSGIAGAEPDRDVADGIRLNEDKQLALIGEIFDYYQDFRPSRTKAADRLYFYENSMFGFNDGFALYCFIRKFKPARIVEVGSGYSSALMIDVCRDISPTTTLTFIDPYSTKILEVLRGTPRPTIDYLRQEVQTVGLECFQALDANDILFIDTSHVLKIGSDLSAIFFRILPSLKPGVLVHIHDIWYPFEYPQDMILEGCSYNEAYFVRAFLQYNTGFEILFFGSFLESRHKEAFARLPGYFKDTGKSLWLRKVT